MLWQLGERSPALPYKLLAITFHTVKLKNAVWDCNFSNTSLPEFIYDNLLEVLILPEVTEAHFAEFSFYE
jgi:hypothetical protein